jgi:hypothetical protein
LPAAGHEYEIMMTWPASVDLGTIITIEIIGWDIHHDEVILDTILLDQTVAPSDVNAFGADWKSLGMWTIDARKLMVKIYQATELGRAVAVDAVWIRDATDAAESLAHIPEPGLLPETAIVDFGCVVGLDSAYDDDQNMVYLRRLSRIGDDFFFSFASDAPGLADWTLDFTRNIADELWSLEEAEALEFADDPYPSSCYDDEVHWEGWLVTGDMVLLAEEIADGTDWEFHPGTYQIEPALVQNLVDNRVRSINIANAERVKVQPSVESGATDDNCATVETGLLIDYDPDRHYINKVCMHGVLKFVEGFNCSIRQDSRANTITFNAAVGAGSGLPREEIQLYPAEVPPHGSLLLSGGPRCDELISAINGMTGTVIQLKGGSGVNIVADPVRSWRLVVDANLHSLAMEQCLHDTEDVISSSSSLSLPD